ncbi:MAG: SIR2 family protein [Gammaproteobacteria bacterium]|nr:SIR2 family protein [Gammaproteobacteria bacterium]
MDDDFELTLDAFVRSFGVRSVTPHSLFLGAGASISSGIPSAQACIWEWKRDLFLTNNPGLEAQFDELSLPSSQRRIQQWLDQQGTYPQEGEPDEYGFYIQKCFPIPDDRRAYFQEKVLHAQPHIGYRLLCHLAQADLIRSVWSTNFDGLPARAAATFKLSPLEVGIDSQERAVRQTGKGELLCVSLHGDYRYDALKNTSYELQRQEEALSKALIDELRQRPTIVCGYSGRDQSVMNVLRSAFAAEGTGTLYWCGFGDGDAPEPIAVLIQNIRANGGKAYYIPSLGFDDLMTRLSLYCLDGEHRDRARDDIVASASKDLLERQPFEIPEFRANTVIKSNAFEIDCPSEVLEFDLKAWPTERVWSWLRETIGDRAVVAVPFKGKIYALGTVDSVKDVFGDNLKGRIERTSVSPDELRYEDGAIVSLMRDTLVHTLAENADVASNGRSELWFKQPLETTKQNGHLCHAHESVVVFLRRFAGTQYVVLKPSIKVLDAQGKPVASNIAATVKLRILGYQHNKPFNIAMNKWRRRLFPKGTPLTFEFPSGVASSFKFRISRTPIFAEIGRPRDQSTASLPSNLRPLLKHRGLELTEPSLVFGNRNGTGVTSDTHPIRGVVANRPYDYPLTTSGLAPSLRIGVICPQSETSILRSYLQKANQGHQPSPKERDYLVDYPGFQQAYGLPIELPEPGSPGWHECAEPLGTDTQTRTISVAQQITAAVESVRASYAPHVILIFFPRRWEGLRGYRDDHERFDVHDFVKAYAVQRGNATQFLTEDTLSDKQQCRVWWWLSLALYVKGMRTPWVLDGLDEDTAYVGLGFSVDRNAQRGAHVVLGCSHIYSARGEGLQYRLSKVEDPLIRRGNPFMSKDDARRTGETIRQLFYHARMGLPRRVVLHKRTPFLKDEREGLLDGLSGVEAIDMLSIQQDQALRYVASVRKSDGSIDEDNYPVRRGTVMNLDRYSALLWVHGATMAINPSFKYFQGKRRIPAPLTLQRYAGDSSLEQLSSEILGLSKMNWNTFDLYTKMPATLQSSGEIARIGSLLQRFGAESYDYRLFI